MPVRLFHNEYVGPELEVGPYSFDSANIERLRAVIEAYDLALRAITGHVVHALNHHTGTDIWRDVIRLLPGFDATHNLQPYSDWEDIKYGDRFVAYGDHKRCVEYRFSHPDNRWVAWAVIDAAGNPL
jgi:hypothetical protein